MKKKSSASSAPGKRAGKSVRHIPDSQIDFSTCRHYPISSLSVCGESAVLPPA